jgi:hypothetical protein
MFKEAGEAVSEGFGLTPKQRQLIIRVLWVLAVSAHMAYVCGIFAFMGIGVAPFARSEDVEGMKRASVVNARIQIIQEMRVQKNAWCKIADDATRDSILRYLVRLQGELKEITGEIEPVQPDCSRLVVTPPGSP